MKSNRAQRGLPLMETLAFDHVVRKWWEGRLQASDHGITWPLQPTADNLDQLRKGLSREEGHREMLVSAVSRQYQKSGQAISKKIAALGLSETRTVTTGHQLCLATGPAFTYYKVLSAVVLAEQLEARWGTPVVPVFWLASEDHDFEEIQSLWDGQGWQTWSPASVGGAVGRMGTEGLRVMLENWSDAAGVEGERKSALLKASHGALTDVMRRWMHGAFGDDRIVVVDGDDVTLKAAFSGAMAKELSDKVVERCVSEVNDTLQREGHAPQVHVRPVNLFYLSEGRRERIHSEAGHWAAGDQVWPDDESVLKELESSPARFSPNALLRPVFQSMVLPDVAVVGGLAEVAYWLQLTQLFPAFGLIQPALVPRDGARVLSKKLSALAEEFGISDAQLGDRLEVWESNHVSDSDPPDTQALRLALERGAKEVGLAFKELDASLLGSVESTKAKMAKLLDKLDEQARRAVRRQSQVDLARLARLHQGLYPEGVAQERVVNWHVLASQWAAGAPSGMSLEAQLALHFRKGHDEDDWSPLLHTVKP